MEANVLLNIGTVVATVVATGVLVKYRVDRLEIDREKDAQNIQTAFSNLTTEIKAVDDRLRDHTANIYEGLDSIRNAGGILESRVSALETVLDPRRVHEHNKRQGAESEQLRRLAEDVRKLEGLIEKIRCTIPMTCPTYKG